MKYPKELIEWLKVKDRNAYEVYNYIRWNYPEIHKEMHKDRDLVSIKNLGDIF